MKVVYILLALVLVIGSCLMFSTGYNKLTVYYNSENYPSLNKNAYVGGDAYNYIINAGQATAYFVLGVGGILSALVCLVCFHLCSLKASILSENSQPIEKDEEPKPLIAPGDRGQSGSV